MEKKDFVKLAILGVAVSICMSAQIAHPGKQVAMTKCYKPEPQENGDGSDDQSNGDNNSEDMSQLDQQASIMEGKSAAKRVIEGIHSSSTTVPLPRKSAAMNGPSKSAAKKAMEIEFN